MIRYFNVTKDTLPVFGNILEKDATDRFTDLSVSVGAISEEAEGPVPVGILIGHVTENIFILDWLYVEKNYRRKGIGSQLLNKMLFAIDSSTDLEGCVALYADKVEELTPFFDSFEALCMETEGRGQLTTTLDKLHLPKLKKNYNPCTLLSNLSKDQLREFEIGLFSKNKSENIHVGVSFPICPDEYARESQAVVHNGKVKGLMLLQKSDEDTYFINWAYCNPSFLLEFVYMIDAAAKAIISNSRKAPKDITLGFGSLTENTIYLANKLFSEVDFEPFMMAYIPLSEHMARK